MSIQRIVASLQAHDNEGAPDKHAPRNLERLAGPVTSGSTDVGRNVKRIAELWSVSEIS
jgi:hypothetical protein